MTVNKINGSATQPGVIHLVRWLLPFTASFIRNQIVCHQRYSPAVIFLQKDETYFYQELSSGYAHFYPFESAHEKFLYEKMRILTAPVQKRIIDYIRGVSPKILHIHYGVDCLIYADVIRQLSIPTCVSFYGYDCSSFPERFFGYGKKWLQKKVFDNPAVTAVLAMTHDMKEDLMKLGCPEEKIIVHYYGTDTSPFFIKREYRKKDHTDLLIVSSLSEKKGHFFLIDAFEKIARNNKKTMRLHIVGDGPLRKEIENHIKQTGLSNIILHGAVRYGSDEHKDFLRMADIFVHPSITSASGDKEGIPGAIIEAMAAGLPVVSTYHAGIPHVIEHKKNGMLVAEHHVDELAKALEILIRDEGFRKQLAENGQQYAINFLDVNEKEKELERIYDKIHNERKLHSSSANHQP